jgi:hypothetical protein
MAIQRRVTARFRSRRRAASATPGASPSGDDLGNFDLRSLLVDESDSGGVAARKSDMRNLPVAESGSGGVGALPAPGPTAPRPMSLSSHLREARARAEEILWQHPRREGPTGSTCQLCLVAYPCDAMRAAEDVIAISAKLRLGQPVSGAALLELMTELVALGAPDRAEDAPPQYGLPGSASRSAAH